MEDMPMKDFFTKEISTKDILAEAEKSSFNPYLYREKVYSEFNEDGIIQEILRRLETQPNKSFVEFGGWDGKYFSNTANLRENYGWSGILFEAQKDKINDNIKNAKIYNEMVTTENVNELFIKYNVEKNLGLLSIDIDSNDIYIFEALDLKNLFHPSIIVIEYNPGLPNNIPLRIKKDQTKFRSGYFNANLNAMYDVAKSKEYCFLCSIVYNAFFIRKDIFSELGVEEMDKKSIMIANDKESSRGQRGWRNKVRKHNAIWLTEER